MGLAGLGCGGGCRLHRAILWGLLLQDPVPLPLTQPWQLWKKGHFKAPLCPAQGLPLPGRAVSSLKD